MNTYQKNNTIWKFPHYEVGEKIDWELLCREHSWLEDMKIVPQDHQWHAEGDVFTHTVMVVDALIASAEYALLDEQEQHVLFAAAIMHDIEKRSTTRTEFKNGRDTVTSPLHARKGESTVRSFFYRHFPEASFKVRETVAKLVRHHGLPFWAIEKKDPIKEVIAVSLAVDMKLLYLLARSDALGRVCTDPDDILLKIELFKAVCEENSVFDKKMDFPSGHARFFYLNRDDAFINYEPYDDFPFEVTVMCGVPGVGKDTFIQDNLDLPMLSLDALRRENKIKRGSKKYTGRMLQEAKEQARVFMRRKESFVFNATNVTADLRGKWISLFREYRAKVKIVYLEVPHGTLLARNKTREHPVPYDAIEDFFDSLEMPGYSEAHEVEYIVEGELQ